MRLSEFLMCIGCPLGVLPPSGPMQLSDVRSAVGIARPVSALASSQRFFFTSTLVGSCARSQSISSRTHFCRQPHCFRLSTPIWRLPFYGCAFLLNVSSPDSNKKAPLSRGFRPCHRATCNEKISLSAYSAASLHVDGTNITLLFYNVRLTNNFFSTDCYAASNPLRLFRQNLDSDISCRVQNMVECVYRSA